MLNPVRGMEYYLFVPSNYEHRLDGAGHNKFLALWGSLAYSQEGQLQLWINTWPANSPGWQSKAYVAAWVDEDEVRVPSVAPDFIADSHRGSWIRIRYHIKPASSPTANDGAIEMWRDDSKLLDLTSVGWYHSGENGFRHGYLMGWSSSGFTQETKIFLDDFKVSVHDPGW